nr:selenium-dependent molybdenum cofactor biosynthesis protein YqeB [Desulfitobacterium dichloroeliminans]
MTPRNVADSPIVLIRGAGEQASGVGWALHKAGFRVVMTEIAQPLMVRWPVCFGTAILEGSWEVEGIQGIHLDSPLECPRVWQQGKIPILVDPDLKHLPQIRPDVLVDAIMAKRNLGTTIDWAPLTIGMGPGFCAGKDVHKVLETMRGHNLGRLLNSGYGEPNTGIPEAVMGYTKERVLYAPVAGIFEAKRRIGEEVRAGDILGLIHQGEQATPVQGNLSGVVRGLLRSGTTIVMDESSDVRIKVGDIDPRFIEEYCWTVSDKARTLGTSVLLGIIEWMNGGK